MKLAQHAVRFDMGGIPVAGNTVTGAIVGLTAEGAALCDAMNECDVARDQVPEGCAQLVAYLAGHGFLVDGSNTPHEHPVHIQSAYLHVTNRCNLSCVGCYSFDEHRNCAEDPSFEVLSHALDVLVALGVHRLVISGGEPFLRDDLPRITASARERGMDDIVVLTNGLACTDEQLAALAGCVDTVSVSFDGASRASDALVRGEQRIVQLIDTIERIKEAGIHAHMLPTIHARNIDDIPSYLELARRLNVTLGFSMLSGSRAVLGDLYFEDAGPRHLADAALCYQARIDDAGIASGAEAAGALHVCASCGAGSTGVSVAADGNVYPCHMLHVPELRLGNAFVDDAATIATQLQAFALPSVDETDGCKQCQHRYLCGGGCRGRSYIEHGRLDARDPYCAYYGCAIDRAVQAFVESVRGR